MARYEKQGWITKHIANPIIKFITNVGVSLRGSRILAVLGRKSGQIRTTPVNPLEVGGARHPGAPRQHRPRALLAPPGARLYAVG